MAKRLQSMKMAVLMANGFNERDFTAIQKAMIEQGASLRIVSTDPGLVNGWDGKGWGHNYAVDAQLNSALGIDYDALIIPGGQRSFEKLKLTAHSRRFIGSFLASMKPVFCMGDAVQLLAHTDQLSGKTISAPEEKKAVVEAAGAKISDQPVTNDGILLTSDGTVESLTDYTIMAVEMAVQTVTMVEAA